jgi:hypothetical protein
MHSIPPYEPRHSGPLLVVGPAPSVHEDLAAARGLYSGAKLAAVNAGAQLVVADFLVSQHPDILALMRDWQLRLFGARPSTHCPGGEAPRTGPAVDYCWIRGSSGATSAWGAVRVGKAMGFSPIVLCGCPLTGGDGYAMPWPKGGVGTTPAKDGLIQSYQERLRVAAKAEGQQVFSMSCYTRSVLGAPP